MLRTNLIGGLADQAIVSFGNFALGILLARLLPVADFGVYSVAMSFLLFFNTLHQAFIVYPLSVGAAAAPPSRFAGLVATALTLSPLCAVALLPVLGAALLSVHHLMLAPAAFFALFAWQLQEVVRRGFLARRRPGLAVLLDGARYLAPLAAILALAHRISAEAVFLLIGAASMLAILPALWRLRQGWRIAISTIPQEFAAHWRLSKPVLGANLLAMFTTQWFLWLPAWQHRPENAAALVALTNIVAIASPVMLGAENILVPEIARARASLSFAAMLRLVSRYGALCLLLVAPFFLLILAYPQEALRLAYGPRTAYAAYPTALRMLAGVYACYLVSYILGATLRGYRDGAAALRMQLYPAVLGLSLGSWLTLRYGVDGAALAALLAGLVRVGTGIVHVLRLRETIAPLQPAFTVPT